MDGQDLYTLLTKIKKFENRSNTRFTEQWNRIKDAKEFLWTKPLSTEVSKLLGNKRYRGRLDVVSNAIRSIVNSYCAYPYKPKTNNPNLQQAFDKLDDDISEAVELALKSAVSFGIGYIVVLPTEKNAITRP